MTVPGVRSCGRADLSRYYPPRRRGMKKAIVALARRLAVILHRMRWNDVRRGTMDEAYCSSLLLRNQTRRPPRSAVSRRRLSRL
jgi:hypothetical protein